MTATRKTPPRPLRRTRPRTAAEQRADTLALLAETEITRAQALTRSSKADVLATVDRLRRVGTDVKAVRS